MYDAMVGARFIIPSDPKTHIMVGARFIIPSDPKTHIMVGARFIIPFYGVQIAAGVVKVCRYE